MRVFCSALALSAALALTPAFAQNQSPEQLEANMNASMAAAQAEAARPGDEALTCDQLQAEMGAAMSDPAFQAQVAEMGASAQAQLDRAQAGRNQAMAGAGASMAMGVASSFIPGLGYAQMAAQYAQMAQMQSQARQAGAEREAMMGNMQAMMPQMMRGQRLYELAEAQHCAFLQQPDADPAQ